MLHKEAGLYAIAVASPAAAGLATVAVFSRTLVPAEYGHFALIMTGVVVATGLTSRWLTIGITRLYPAAERDGRAADFVSTALAASAAAMILAMAILLGADWAFAAFTPSSGGQSLLALGFAIFTSRTLVLATNSIRRARFEVGHYAVVESAQALSGFGLSLLLNRLLGATAGHALLGTAIGYALVATAEAASLVPVLCQGRPRLHIARRFGAFSGPLTVVHGLSLLMGAADQFFVQAFLGAGAGGLYNAVMSLANRPIALAFSGLSMIVFPHSVRVLERDGWEACRRSEQRNVVLVLSVALPATVGLMLVGPEAVGLLLGPAYRAPGTMLFPWLVAAAFIGRMAVDVFDHAFYLSKRTGLLFATLAPAACLGVACNLLLTPRLGLAGAAVSACGQSVLMLALSIAIGRRVFRIGWPPGLAGVLSATTIMALTVATLRASMSDSGLLVLVCAGSAAYGVAAFGADVLGLRRRLIRRVPRTT